MNLITTLLRWMDLQMETPTIFGWFHILSLILTAAAAVGLCLWHKKRGSDPSKVLLVVSVFVILLEIYKQINYSFSYKNDIDFDYQWYAFPFQFCSTPMYVGLLAGLTKKGKFHDALCAYLATFSTFAGLCVMLYPGDVFTETVGINIQTMICHGSMVVMGVYLFFSGHVKTRFSTIWKAAAIFAAFVCMAAIMNEIAHDTGLLKRETFNMFFISPYCPPSLPVFSLVQNAVSFFPLELVIYIAGFTLAATIILLLAKGFQTVCAKKAHV